MVLAGERVTAKGQVGRLFLARGRVGTRAAVLVSVGVDGVHPGHHPGGGGVLGLVHSLNLVFISAY